MTQRVASSRASFRWAALLAALLATLAAAPAAASRRAAEYNDKGVAYYEEGRWQEAVEAFSHAYDLVPDNNQVRRNLCNALQARAGSLAADGDFESGVEELLWAIVVDPENAQPLVQLGSYHLRLDEVNDAIFRLEDALDLEPDNLLARELLGDAYYQSNDLASAIAQWRIVYERDPGRAGLQAKLRKAGREARVESSFQQHESRHFTLSFSPGASRAMMNQILRILEEAYWEIGRETGDIYPPGPIQVIAYKAEDFKEATLLGEHVGAVYDGKVRVPVEDERGRSIEESELRRRLWHEYVHVVLRHKAGDNIPWWANEGLAQTLSEPLGPDEQRRFLRALDQGNLASLGALEANQLEQLDEDQLYTAYLQSHATVRMLWERYGTRGVMGFLDYLAVGSDPEEALRGAYNMNYAKLYDLTADYYQE
jgi:cytochrome c-type biogenesis protein CcmH/NrfG